MEHINIDLQKIIGNNKEHARIKVNIPFTDFYKIMDNNNFIERISLIEDIKIEPGRKAVTRQGKFFNKDYVIIYKHDVEFINGDYGISKNVTELEWITLETYNNENPCNYSWNKKEFYY